MFLDSFGFSRAKLARTALSGVAALSVTACASRVTNADRNAYLASLNAGDYQAAEQTAFRAGRIDVNGQTQNIVWSLNAGSALFDEGEFKKSVAVLDVTERLAQADDLDQGKALTDYTYTTYDGVMTNYYKGLAFMALGKRDDARVEFNRSQDRSRRAEEKYRKQADAAASRANDPNFASVLQKAQTSKEYQDSATHLAQAAKYAAFENPFATYMAGLFALSDGNSDRAQNLLGRAAQMLGPQSQAAADLSLVRRSRGGMAPQTWVLFENGQSPTFAEQRIILPMVTGAPMTLALPVLVFNASASDYLTVQSSAGMVQTQAAGSFDAVVAGEFQRQQPAILAAAVAEVIAKNVASVMAAKSGVPMLGLVAAVGANISSADTRSWTALPKEFQAARLAAPVDGKVTLTDSRGGQLGTVTVPTNQSSIIYVKMQSYAARPALQVIKL